MKPSKLYLLPITVASISTFLTACTSETESDLLKTNAISADISINSNGERARIVAELNVGDSFGSNVNLSEGDTLRAIVNGQTIQLIKDTDILDIDYEGRSSVVTGNSLYTIQLNRKKEENASASVELPLGFLILTPEAEKTFRYDEDIEIHIDGIDLASETSLIVNYACPNNTGGLVTGSFSTQFGNSTSNTFNAKSASLIDLEQIATSKPCEFDMEVQRVRTGSFSGALKDNSLIRGIQSRVIKGLEFTF
ncbi:MULTISPECIES: hypothetical protein [unclassified Pseudoalteromonas]|uniref:hypothetical protein n=1 Tax=unclassified Pseudoalteromonas TaxID=194690 RepID=UPI001F34F3B5|nr:MULTISPECIES: hypothetical protein [unclassified Pseudoalteromonas]MCF2828025.1 hypothetical protein [Pseudoalteromonas sp. OF5H-5]MCF2830345.1 hypothetical protein [Pseudoalteromonas sp. DL2-H6]MCF2924192.1 hypothetical protein [Pseudoalteromonas sp. DL2-H1]